MIPCPRAQGLTLCDYVIREEGTGNISLVNTFTRMRTLAFPSTPRPFCVFAALTDGQGEGNLELTVTNFHTDEEILNVRRPIRFPDRFVDVRVIIRLNQCSFPQAGVYLFTLSIDDESIAQRRIRVDSSEEAQ
jgi:hypothetical protein